MSKYFKFIYKSKSNPEIKYVQGDFVKLFKYSPKTKFGEFEISGVVETGFIRSINLHAYEVFLTSPSSSVFSVEIFETEEEVCAT